MSYLGPLRLHFYGQFQAAVSTVNNDPANFDNASFDRGTAYDTWNARGDAAWRLIGCRVTAASHADGSPAAPSDPILACTVADSDRAAPAKLVDLDSEQQMVSTIFGLEMRICDAQGHTLVRGSFEPAAFTNLFKRAPGQGNLAFGAMFQSTLSDLEWTEGQSPFLTELRAAATDGLLSVKFNVDGYDTTVDSPTFTLGRIAGTIGPAAAGEPAHFTAGRHLASRGLNAAVAVVDSVASQVHLDLGNSIPATRPGGPLVQSVGPLKLTCKAAGGKVELDIPWQAPDWYETTAGVVTLPVPEGAIDALEQHPLAVESQQGPQIVEPADGLYARADTFVFRLDPDADPATVRVFATSFGKPLAGTVKLALDSDRLQPTDTVPVGTPEDAITFEDHVDTGHDGWASFSISASDPGRPRGFVDGQVYGVRPVPAGAAPTYARAYPFDFVSVLVFSAWQPHDPITWWGDIHAIFEQYANLYPVMDDFVKLADYASVCAYREQLLLAFGLDIGDPNSMPVTRDLSTAKRDAIVKWLSDEQPLEGTPPAARPAAAARAVLESAPGLAMEAGKAEALSRMTEPIEGT